MAIRRGEEVLLGTEKNEEGIPLPDDSFTRDLKPKDPVFLADGTVQLDAVGREPRVRDRSSRIVGRCERVLD